MNQTLFDKLHAVREKFREVLAERLPEAISALEAGNSDGVAQLHRILHELCGTAGMVGEKQLALTLDPALRLAESCAHDGRAFSSEEHEAVAAQLVQVGNLL